MVKSSKMNYKIYHSPKLKENCCANCRKPFANNDPLKMSHTLLGLGQSSESGVPMFTIVDAIKSIFDASLKLEKKKFAKTTVLHMCLQCTSALSSLYRVYKKFVDTTAKNSIVFDIIKESPFYSHSNKPQETVIYVVPTPYKNKENMTAKHDDDGEMMVDYWQGYNSRPSTPEEPNNDIDTSEIAAADDSPSTHNTINITPPSRNKLTYVTPHVDESMTYLGRLKLKKRGRTRQNCTYRYTATATTGEDPPELSHLRHGSRICPFCKYEFKYMTELNDHLLEAAKIETYHCPYPDCKQKFPWNIFYAKHLASTHGELFGIRGCEKCPLTFNTHFELVKHESSHEEEDHWLSNLVPASHSHDPTKMNDPGTLFACNYTDCGKYFYDSLYLTRHISNRHEPPPIYKCSSCPWVFPTSKLLAEHELCHSQLIKCEECSTSFFTTRSLRNHMFHFHKKFRASGNSEAKTGTGNSKSHLKKHKCHQCPNVSYIKRASLVFHMRMVHEGIEQFTCKVCGRKFVTEEARQKHEETTVHKEYRCDGCPKVFFSKPRFDYHYESHIPKWLTKERSKTDLICDICGKGFTSEKMLNRHFKTHEEKEMVPQICHSCGRNFSSKSTLSRHLKRNRKCKLVTV